ncbi:Na/Pi cotransporter family protein [Marinospirillum minutulum]|uniref:Na/Pi cotransporter family protein n=1 Tax=Marinospirillum minutulum TaxID=64974 RepID=UPI00041BA17C|nr:Na/Pi symporter [Marinospirillum minutulum]
MLRRFTLPLVLLFLAYVLWVGSEFMELALGVAFFIFGMICLEDGFKTFAGGALETLLQNSTNRLWKSLLLGFTSTTLMQSSTLVSLITISFVSSEMIALAGGIGIILGANIGTSTGAWLIAGLGLKVDIASYAMPMLVFGVLLLMQKSKIIKGVGNLVLGVGFLFFGIHFMKEGFTAFQLGFDLSTYSMTGVYGVLLFTLIGTLITFVMQSSHATLLIVIAALAVGQVSYENALALSIGASLGSAISAVIAGFAANLGGKRLAAAQVLFSLVTTLLAMLLINPLMQLVDWMSSCLGIGAEDYLLKLALFQTLFRVLGAVVFMPFISQVESFLIKVIRFVPKSIEQPIYIYPEVLETPSTVVAAVRKEVQHLFDNAFGLLASGLSLKRSTLESEESLSAAVKATRRIFPIDVENAYEEKIKSLHSEIIAFISEAQMRESTRAATEELYVLRQASRDIVSAVKGMKHLHNNLSRYGLSANLAVRDRYDQIRLQLARLLRELQVLLAEEPTSTTALALDSLRLSVQKASRTMTDELDEMIRYRRLTANIATSIMNDENYVTDIANNLISAVHALLTKEAQETAESFNLDDVEIQQLIDKEAGLPL